MWLRLLGSEIFLLPSKIQKCSSTEQNIRINPHRTIFELASTSISTYHLLSYLLPYLNVYFHIYISTELTNNPFGWLVQCAHSEITISRHTCNLGLWHKPARECAWYWYYHVMTKSRHLMFLYAHPRTVSLSSQAIWEADTSWHPIISLGPRYHVVLIFGRFSRVPITGPMMPRGTSLSDAFCIIIVAIPVTGCRTLPTFITTLDARKIYSHHTKDESLMKLSDFIEKSID